MRVADRYCCILLQEHNGTGSDDIAAPYDDDALSIHFNLIMLQDCHDGARCISEESVFPGKKSSCIHVRQPVYILIRINECNHLFRIDLLRKRHHHKNACYFIIIAEIGD